jgi:hypothetical protein
LTVAVATRQREWTEVIPARAEEEEERQRRREEKRELVS